MDYKEIIKKRIEELPESLRLFVINENWRRESEKIGQKFALNNEQYTLFENELFLVLICFEPRKDFKQNIKNELGISMDMVSLINEDVDKNIFSKILNELNEIEKNIDKKDTPSNLIGQSFENVILNQAKAMMPALEEGEEVREVDSSEQLVDSREDSDYIEIREKRDRAVAPSNLPTEKIETNKIDVPNYAGGDPYREPLE